MTTRVLFFPLAILVSLPIPLAAQTPITTGVIQGELQDATGAVLPGVSVEVQNLDTNLVQTHVTDGSGRFVALQLPPGRYRVTFRLSGFTTIMHDDVGLTVGQAINLNLRMTVSTVQETVTVSGTALDHADARREREQILELPAEDVLRLASDLTRRAAVVIGCSTGLPSSCPSCVRTKFSSATP